MTQQIHPDQKYVQALVENNSSLLQELYQKHARNVSYWVQRNNGTESDAADLMQEALLTIARQAARPGGLVLTCSFGTYLHMVVRGKWLNELSTKKRSGVTNLSEYELNDTPPADSDLSELIESELQHEARRSLLLEVFETLGESCRKIIRLSWSGLGMQEVSEKLEISYGYARKQKSLCVEKLVEKMRAHSSYNSLR